MRDKNEKMVVFTGNYMFSECQKSGMISECRNLEGYKMHTAFQDSVPSQQ